MATVLGLFGVWFPNLFKNEIAPKLIYSFIVVAIGTAVATGVLQYLPK